MPVSNEYLAYVLEQLELFGPVTAKRMFGGVGLYHEGLFFALVEADTLRLKVDDSNRADFEARDMGPFKPFADKSMIMQYYAVPAEVLEDPEQLAAWARNAFKVALRARKKSSPKA